MAAKRNDETPEVPGAVITPEDVAVLLARIKALEENAAARGEPKSSEAERLDRIVASIEKIANESDRGHIKQISIAKAKHRTPWNKDPQGRKRTKKLNVITFMNGFRLQERLLHDEEIDAVNKIQPGAYGPKKAYLVLTKAAEDGVREKMIVIPNKTPDQRNAMIRYAMDGANGKLPLVNLLEKMMAEAPVSLA